MALFEQGIDVRVLLAAGDRDDALMGVGVGGAIELLARSTRTCTPLARQSSMIHFYTRSKFHCLLMRELELTKPKP